MNDKLNPPSGSDIKKVLRLDDNKLPSFPQAVARLLKASKDKTASLADLSKIVETDPGISVKVLEIVNSAMYGLGRKITSLSEAVVFLGLDEINKIAIGMTIFEKMFKTGDAKLFNRLHFWRHCISVAVLSMEIAREIKYSNPEEAYIAGLLHDVGKIFLDTRGKNNYGNFIQELSTSTDLIIEKERTLIGLGHDDVGAFFCSRWKLPEKLSLPIKYHHQPFEHLDLNNEEMQLISIVSLSNFLCWTQGMGSFEIIRPPILSPEVEKIVNLDTIDIIQCIQNMNREVESVSEFYQFIFPSADQLRENLLWANLKLSKANTKYYYQENPLVSYKDEVSIQHSNMPFDMDSDFGKPLAKAKSVQEVFDIVMYKVGHIFQPLHWSILLKDSKTSDMVFSVVVGSNKEKLQGVKIPKGEGVAGYIMETGKSLIIEDVTKNKHFSIRADKYSGFKTQSIIGTPLKTENKTFGVIELINRISENPFTFQDLEVLSSIAEYAAIAIERSYYNQAMTTLVTTDSLTGLKNKWSFEHAVRNKDDVLRHYGSIFAMLIIDIARLLQSTKTQNHDDMLKKLAGVLSKTKRREDDVFRYGECSFIMLLSHTYTDGAKKAKERILKALWLSIPEKKTTSVDINISSQTVSAGDSSQLKTIVGKFLSKSKTLVNEDIIADMEENLQPFLEEENRKEIDETKQKQTFGREVSLGGEFTRLKTRESGHIRVESLSLQAIGFRISKSHRMQINDFLDIHFILDDISKAIVKRRIVVRSVKGNYIYADFYNPPPYAKKLGFYLMS